MPNEPMPKALFDPREADAKYEPFPSFADWAAQVSLDEPRWERYTSRLEILRKESSPELLKKAKEVVERAAAVDTGAIEGLYETDRGFTFTVATEAVLWQSVVEEKKGSQVLALIKSQLRAYDYVLDFATKKVPLEEAWMRRLHEEICRDQKTYAAYTEVGKQELPLPKGE
jgi:Fic family protein